MKKVVIVMLMLVGVTALAQQGERGTRSHMKDFSPEQMATLQTKKATLALDLTNAQQAQMKTFFTEEAKIRKAKMEERKAQKENGEKKALSSEERYAKANARLDHQLAQKEKLKKILSDEQLEKWQRMKHRKGKHHEKKGNRRKGHQNKQRE